MLHSAIQASVQRQQGTTNPRLLKRASQIQRSYIHDRSALISYLAGRRHGKTEGVATRIVENAREHTMQAYVAPTITRAKEIILPIFEQLKRDCGIEFNRVGDLLTFPSGGQLRLMGMSNEAEIEKLRGEDLLAAYFDECGVPKSKILKTAVLSCAWEALRKHRGEPGSGVTMSGTPGKVPGNPADAEPDFWWQVTTQNEADGTPMYGTSRHFGLIFDNPIFQTRMPDGRTKAEHSIDEDLKKRIYLSREDSRFRREVLAQWCLPSELRCYAAFNKILRPQSSMPMFGRTVLAVDFGWADHTAIVILRLVPFEERYPQADGSVEVLKGERCHVLYAFKEQHMRLGALAELLNKLRTLYAIGTIVGDSGGGASRQVVESFASTWGIPMLPALKNGMGVKKSRIHTIDDLFAIGHIVLYEQAACLADELGYLVWNEDRDDHDERQPDNAADAFGYAIIETYVPTTSTRIASKLEQEREAAETRKRDALNRGRR